MSSEITVQKEWMAIGIFSALIVAAEVCSFEFEPSDFVHGRNNGFTLVAGLLWWLGHGIWLSMDRRRRGLEMGGWRYAVIFLGPLAIWLYLILEYRQRALYLIPLSLGIYGVIVVVILGVVTIISNA